MYWTTVRYFYSRIVLYMQVEGIQIKLTE